MSSGWLRKSSVTGLIEKAKNETVMLRTAIIGCGKIAGGYDLGMSAEWVMTHASAYRHCKDTNLVAIADTSLEALNSFGEKWSVQKRYQDYREMLSREKLDIVSICLPTEMHREVFEVACRHQVAAIFMEKPLAYTSDDIKAMLHVSSEKIVAVNYFRRWNSTLQEIVDRLHNGEYGVLRAASIYYQKGILNNGSHAIDMMRWFFGEPANTAFTGTAFDDEKDPGLDFVLTFNNGAKAVFTNIPGCNYHLFEIDLLLDKSRISIKQRGQYTQEYSVTPEPYYKTFNIVTETGPLMESAWKYCMKGAIDELAMTVLGDGKVSCNMMDGFRANELCLDIIDEYRRS
jgi:predicted dehydrogenase